METALSITGWLMIAATVLPLVRSDYWIVRVFDFPRFQITVIFIAVFAGYLSVREDPSLADQLFLALMSLCLVYQLWRMWPYTPLHPRQVKRASSGDEANSLSLLIANVLETNRDNGKLRRLIDERDPDVILLVETDTWWEENLRELERTRPHVLKQPQNNTYGMLLYSRLPLVDPQIRFLVEEDVPSIHVGVKLASGELVRLHGLHPRPPAPGESTRSTERDAELLIMAQELANEDRPNIVVGDLNDVAWSHTSSLFQKLSRLLDPRVGRGFYSTFNANWPFIRFPLDHAFVSRHFRVAAFEVLPHVGSDHLPVFARMTLSPAPDDGNRPPPSPDPDEKQEAEEKISRTARRRAADRCSLDCPCDRRRHSLPIAARASVAAPAASAGDV